ncbi:MAG: MBL fold metallo-hydrolase [Promethearchaeota archaeon]
MFLDKEGQIFRGCYLIDGELFGLGHHLSLYVIQSEGQRLLIDVGTSASFRRVIRKLKRFGLYPIHKIVLTHSHWDHVDAVRRFKKEMVDLEIHASVEGLNNLSHPERMNAVYGTVPAALDDVVGLKDGDQINVGDVSLDILSFPGHTADSIAILYREAGVIFVGDAIIDRYDRQTFTPVFFPPDFDEKKLFCTFNRLDDLNDVLDSICLSHFGAWTGKDFQDVLSMMRTVHVKVRDAMKRWFSAGLNIDEMAINYLNEFIPGSKMYTKGRIKGLRQIIEWLLTGLQASGML